MVASLTADQLVSSPKLTISRMRQDYTWVVANDTQFSVGGHIGSGGSGDVYKVQIEHDIADIDYFKY